MAMEYAFAADVGGTNIRAAVVNRQGEVLFKLKEPTGKDPLSVLCNLMDRLHHEHSTDICGIAVAVAGLVDRKNGIILQSPNIPSLNGLGLRTLISERYGLSVILENDANAAAFGEKCAGAGKAYRDFVMLTLGTGIGGGIVLNGSLLPVAAEIGHMTINANGRSCACGNLGCLETYASASAIIGNAVGEIEKGASSALRELYNGNFYKINAEDIYRAALDGDSTARNVLREAGKSLGAGIACIINLMSPEAVVLAGGLMGAWNIYVEAAIAEASKRTLKELHRQVSVIPSALGDDAGVIGAAGLVFNATGEAS